MKITGIRLHNVKRFAGRGVAIEGIGDGVNVLTAANEHGKSTCFEALHALFFQPHTGTPKGVQLLRPYSGGSPLVEADIALTDGRYRLTKQFYGGRRAAVTDLDTGRLVAQADEAEAFIGQLIRGGTAGPAGLLWVRQGITGIEKRSSNEEESEKRVRESLLTSVQGEVEALTGGRRMAEITAACEEELSRLVTATLRPKTGGRYAVALDERERLQAEEARLRDEVATLRDALDKRRLAQTRLKELENPEDVAARALAITSAEAAFDAAKSHGEALKAANAEAKLAANRRDAAQQALAQFDDATQRDAELRERLALADRNQAGAVEKREAAVAESERAMAEVQAAEQDERETQQLMSRLEAAMQARKAAEDLVILRSRLERAEAARIEVEDAEAAFATLTVPAETLEKLEALEVKIIRLRAAVEATLPTFRVDYAEGADGSILLDDQPVPPGQERSFANAARLDIAGVGTLTLRANRQPQSDTAIEAAEAAHRNLLASLGVESLAAARLRDRAARDKAAALDRARQRLQDLAPQGIGSLQIEIARLAEIADGELELKADPQEIREHLAGAGERVAAARNAVREAMPARSRADEAVVNARADHVAIGQALAGLDAVLGPEAQRRQRHIGLSETLADARQALDAAEAKAAPLRDAAHDLEGAEASLRRARSVQKAAEQEASHLRETLADLNGQIRARSEHAVEEAWLEARDALAAVTKQVERFETEIKVLNRLRQALAATRSAARDLYLKPVMSELRPLVGLLFDDISITFDEETLLPQIVHRNGQDEEVDRLSGGMREQLSVLTRLAFGRLLARDGRPAPVILDDALVYSDDDRIERMFDALHRQSRDQQILVFSCRQRAFAKLGGNVLQMNPWQPE